MRTQGKKSKFFEMTNTNITNHLVVCFVTIFAVFTLSDNFVFAQTTPTAPPVPRPTVNPRPARTPVYPSAPRVPSVSTGQNKRQVINESEFPAEKSVETDPKVNVYLTVCEGSVKINSWDREEVRAFVKNGSEVGFKISQKHPSSGKPLLMTVVAFDPQKYKQLGLEECLRGEEIELDVPRNAYLNVKTQEGDINISSVRKVDVFSVSGNVWVDDIAQGVTAKTLGEGDLTIENSCGNFTLDSTIGNITAINLKPLEIENFVKAKSNSGTITLQSINHSQVNSNSSSGMIKLIGDISSGGQYRLITNNSIWLVIPTKSSLIMNATYSNFQSEIPFDIDNVSKNPNSPVQARTSQIGSGDANIILQTSGIIRIKKSN